MNTLGLNTWAGRCNLCGFHVATQGCRCDIGEWPIFVRALRDAADDNGVISQTRVRPLIQAIPHKHRGQLYRRAVSDGLISRLDKEPSTDARGRNTDKDQWRYRWEGKAAA